jgi:transitional endoplasmic reticulum ATPase
MFHLIDSQHVVASRGGSASMDSSVHFELDNIQVDTTVPIDKDYAKEIVYSYLGEQDNDNANRSLLYKLLSPGCTALGCYRIESVDGVVDVNALFRVTSRKTRYHKRSRKRSGQSETFEANMIVGGLDGEIESLCRLVELKNRFGHVQLVRGVLLKGPSGCGKRLLIESVAKQCNVPLHRFDAASARARTYVGESEAALRDAFVCARLTAVRSDRCVMLSIADLDTMCPQRDDAESRESVRVVAQLLTLMDGLRGEAGAERVLVVATTSRPNGVDAALRRPGRFDKEIDVPVPANADERLRILHIHLRSLPCAQLAAAELRAIAEQTVGFVGAELARLVQRGALLAMARDRLCRDASSSSTDDSLPSVAPLHVDDLRAAFHFVSATSRNRRELAALDVPSTRWQDVGGLDDVKQQLIEAIVWPQRYAGAFERFGLSKKTGVLLHGPPGTGKTLLARACASSCNVAFLHVSPASIFSPFVGGAEAAVRECFRKARSASPCILFFDEIDTIVGKRSSSSSSTNVAERVLSTMLNEMDGVEQSPGVIVLAATNRVDMIDAALLRPGRFDKSLLVGKPDCSARLELWRIYTAKMPIGDDVDLDELASDRCSRGLTGADIDNACREAALHALRRDLSSVIVTRADFEHVLDIIAAGNNDDDDLFWQSIDVSDHLDFFSN